MSSTHLIETIPLEEDTDAPGQAVITSATSPEPGAVRLVLEAPHATSFTIQHKGPGEPEFAITAEDFTDDTISQRRR